VKVVIDVEANALVNPTDIWVIVCKDIDSGEFHVFREVTKDEAEKQRFLEFSTKVTRWIGHNFLNYDWPVLCNLVGITDDHIAQHCIDTLVVSKLVDYPRPGHSIEDYGLEFGIPKGKFVDFSHYSQEMEDYCVRDVEICHKIYLKYHRVVDARDWLPSLNLEHEFQISCNDLSNNGFAFDVKKGTGLLNRVEQELAELDKEILTSFPPKLKLIREIHPKVTKHGTLSRSDFRWESSGDLSMYNGGPFSRCSWVEFNPSSHKQLVDVLCKAGWEPTDKTQTHIDTERELSRLKYSKSNTKALDIQTLSAKLEQLQKTGWKINENNLITLPDTAPASARSLAKRILLESRRRTLTEWLNQAVTTIEIEKISFGEIGIEINGKQIASGEKNKEIRINGGVEITWKNPERVIEKPISNTLTDCLSPILLKCMKDSKINVQFVKENKNYLWITVTGQEQLENFYVLTATPISVGTKTIQLKYKIISQRIHGHFNGLGAWSHRMNHQNPNTANIPTDGKLYGKEMRSLWCAPKGRLLVGVDAESIQLRIFAHYINSPEFTEALVKGKKDDRTDPHSLNQRILGDVCKSRQVAKRFIYALLLGAGISKLAQILEVSEEETQDSLERLLEKYQGFAYLKQHIIPNDARRGWFVGLDGRRVRIPGETPGERKHLCMSGYLQNGEAIVMKKACVKFAPLLPQLDARLVNFVHDEWQTECPNDMTIALKIAKIQADSLKEVGEELKLNCPLAGSFWNEDHKDYTIGTNWYQTH
jgi:DNA polymerase I-like protein with 3'-5' exonuclease and polymerase domains